MGNHRQLVVCMAPSREMSRNDYRSRAEFLYTNTVLDGWLEANWKRFHDRIVDVSELMPCLQSKIARRYNIADNRRGRFWADRFKRFLLEDEKAVFDCLLYTELNPVRAGIVERPEAYEGSSLYYRDIKGDKWMTPFTDTARRPKRAGALRDYKACIYYRGSVPTKENHAILSKRLLAQEEARGFTTPALFSKRVRHITDGIVIGSETFVKEKLERIRQSGLYLRRKKPVGRLNGVHLCLRPQRAT